MWCKNRKKVIKEMKQRGEDPSVQIPAKVEPKQNRNLQRVASQREITPSEDRSRNLQRGASQKEATPAEDKSKNIQRGTSQKEFSSGDKRSSNQNQPAASLSSKQSSVGQAQYKDLSAKVSYKDSPVKVSSVSSSRSEPFAPYVKPSAPSEPFSSAVQQSVTSESYSPIVSHSAPTMPPALLTHPSSASVVTQSSSITNVKSSSSLPSLMPKQVSEPPPVLHTSSLSAPHSTHSTCEPSPEDPTLPIKFMDITQFKAPEDLEEEDKLGDHRHAPAPPTLEPVPTGPADPVPLSNIDPDMHQLTMLLQQGGSVEDVAKSLNIRLDEHTSGLLSTLKQQLDLAATLQNKPVLPMVHSSGNESSHTVSAVSQNPSFNQTSEYEYNPSGYSDKYSSSSYSNQGYIQEGHASHTEEDNDNDNTGVKAALASLLAQQGHRVSMGGTEYSQEDPYSQREPVYAQAHGHEDTYYSKSDQPEYRADIYHEDHNVDLPLSQQHSEFPSESMTTNTAPSIGGSLGASKQFGYGSDNTIADTSTVDSMSKYSYGSESGSARGQGSAYQKYGPESRSDSMSKQFKYGSDSYSSGMDNDGGIGALNRRRSSNAGSGPDLGSGEGMGRNVGSGVGYANQGGYMPRTGSYTRSESDGARSGGVALLGSPPYRSGGATGPAGKSFGRQLSDEGTPRGKGPGGGILGVRPPGFMGNQFGSGRGGSHGPRPLMSFDAARGRSDRGNFRGKWK